MVHAHTRLSRVQVLWPMIEQSACILVPGAYFGDEGKGKTVDAIARHPKVAYIHVYGAVYHGAVHIYHGAVHIRSISHTAKVEVVARVNSGENAGHTVFGENGGAAPALTPPHTALHPSLSHRP